MFSVDAVQTDLEYDTLGSAEQAETITESQEALTAQERLAKEGTEFLDKGGMPSNAQLSAMGMDKPHARGIQSLVWLSTEGDPIARSDVEAMIDQTAKEAQLEQQKVDTTRVPVGANAHTLYEIDGSNSSARFRMVDFDDVADSADDELRNDEFTLPGKEPIIGAINGARITGVESPAAEEHANRYYGLARSMKTDVTKIAHNTGYSEETIRRIKNFIFVDVHDLGYSEPRRFEPSFAMAQSWQRLIEGNPKPHDITMLKHEILESTLMDSGMSQYDAHIAASKRYNYAKESDDYYAALKEH